VTTVQRALAALRLLGDEPMLASELGSRLGVHESTISRLVQILEADGFVRRDGDRTLRLGPTVFALAQRTLDGLDIRRVAAPYLSQLSASTGQTVHLAEFGGSEVVYIDKVESRRPLRMYSRIGAVAPIFCTGVGKAIAAYLPSATQESIAKSTKYVRYTPNTIVGAKAFLEELTRIRERGYALDLGEHEPVIRCAAAPIRDAAGHVRNSLSVSIPTFDGELDDVIPLVLAAAAGVSAELGWSSANGQAAAISFGPE
jgi:DNA-binding IclR family transcriptional regulator